MRKHNEEVEFLGLRFHSLKEASALNAVLTLAEGTRFSYVVTPNVDHLVRLHSGKLPGLWETYRDAALRLCDSRILSRLAHWSGLTLSVVPGSDLTAAAIDDRRIAGMRVAVIGADHIDLAALRLRRPDVCFVQHVPPMGLMQNNVARAAVIAFVAGSKSHLVLFALGSPISEHLCCELRNCREFGGVGLCIGASIEFLTGKKRRAPKILQRLGLEWAFRLASEPRRLWRRYLLDGPRIFAIWQAWLRDRRPR